MTHGKEWENCEGREEGFGVLKKFHWLLWTGWSPNSSKKRAILTCRLQFMIGNLWSLTVDFAKRSSKGNSRWEKFFLCLAVVEKKVLLVDVSGMFGVR